MPEHPPDHGPAPTDGGCLPLVVVVAGLYLLFTPLWVLGLGVLVGGLWWMLKDPVEDGEDGDGWPR